MKTYRDTLTPAVAMEAFQEVFMAAARFLSCLLFPMKKPHLLFLINVFFVCFFVFLIQLLNLVYYLTCSDPHRRVVVLSERSLIRFALEGCQSRRA